jgi:hypothetical protein
MANPLCRRTANKARHHRPAVISALGLTLSAACFDSPAIAAEPKVFLEDATIVGADGTLAISRLQFTDGTTVECDDVTIPFSAGAGGLTVGAPTLTKCVPLKTDHFVPGTYAGPGKAPDVTITVTGPGTGVGGSTLWSLQAAKVDSNTPLSNAQWTAGALSTNPNAEAYLKGCKIAPDPLASYGFGVSPSSGFNNVFVAMAQAGSAMTARILYNTPNAGTNCTLYTTFTYGRVDH